eukprot:7111603-Pyramimonas_sp.AAC.1
MSQGQPPVKKFSSTLERPRAKPERPSHRGPTNIRKNTEEKKRRARSEVRGWTRAQELEQVQELGGGFGASGLLGALPVPLPPLFGRARGGWITVAVFTA